LTLRLEPLRDPTAATPVLAPDAPEVVAVLPCDDDGVAWEAFVGASGESTFCHLAGWRRIMEDVLGHECLYRVAHSSSGDVQGVLPLVRVRSGLFGHFLVSMPFLNYGGPLGSASAQVRLAEYALLEATRSRADLLELRTRRSAPLDLPARSRKVTVLLDLPESPDTLWRQTFSANLRSNIRRAEKQPTETRFGLDQLHAFYEVFARNMRDLGTPTLPRRFFEGIARHFGDRILVGAVYGRGQPWAAGLGFRWRDEFELTWVSSLRSHRDSRPNILLYWSFLKELIGRGVRVFNFGRSSPGSGPHEFKRRWGGLDLPLPWIEWSSRGLTAPPTPERPVFRVATAVWRRLPLPLTNAMGPALARLLP
jgi:serine/alanine adding enzyme